MPGPIKLDKGLNNLFIKVRTDITGHWSAGSDSPMKEGEREKWTFEKGTSVSPLPAASHTEKEAEFFNQNEGIFYGLNA